MPPEEHTTFTISDETAAKLPEIVADQNIESIDEVIDYATDVARDPEIPSETELADLLHRKLTD